jgi:hypothetical protein
LRGRHTCQKWSIWGMSAPSYGFTMALQVLKKAVNGK